MCQVLQRGYFGSIADGFYRGAGRGGKGLDSLIVERQFVLVSQLLVSKA